MGGTQDAPRQDKLVVLAFLFNPVSKSLLIDQRSIQISKNSAAAFKDECSQQRRTDEEFLMI